MMNIRLGRRVNFYEAILRDLVNYIVRAFAHVVFLFILKLFPGYGVGMRGAVKAPGYIQPSFTL